MCICIHVHKNTHAPRHLWHHPHTLKNSYWNTQSMHTHAYTYIFTCICMHTYTYIYTHAYIYIYTCQYTYIHAHIHTHMYNIYICTHASKSETTERQWLRGKPYLTTRSSAHLLGCCIPEGDPSPLPAAQLPVHEEQQISAEQPQPTVAPRHYTITTARHPNYNSSSELVKNSREKWRKWISLTGSHCWPSASANHRQTGWGLHQWGWSDDACATQQRRPRHELAWIWTDF